MTQAKNRNILSRRGLLRGLAATPLAGLVAGCGSLVPSQGPPPELYRLQPKPEFPANLPQVSWHLLVDTPTAPANLDGTRIALLHTPLHVEYYARSNWVDRAPLMIQSAIIAAFEESGDILSVARDSVNSRPDYILATDLRDFQAEYFLGPRPHIRISIIAKLISARERTIVATKRFDIGRPAAADRIGDIVATFSEALGKILGEMVAWTLASGEADRKNA